MTNYGNPPITARSSGTLSFDLGDMPTRPASARTLPQRISALIQSGKFEEAATLGKETYKTAPDELFVFGNTSRFPDAQRRVARMLEIGRLREDAISRELILPETAQILLSNNPANRALPIGGLERYMRSMVADDWLYTGQSIVLARTGEINDGQTRLLSSLLTGRSFLSLVALGVDRDTRLRCDIGERRSPANRMEMMGEPNGKKKSEAAALAFAEIAGRKPQPGEREGFFTAHKPLFDQAYDLTARLYPGANRTSFIAAFFYLLRSGARAESIRDFVRALRNEINLGASAPTFALVSKTAVEPRLRDSAQQMRTVVSVYNAVRQRKRMTNLRYPDTLEPVEMR